MVTTTELANQALAYLGESKISDIDDPDSKAARTCQRFMASTIDETLRLHRWNCAIRRQTLSESLPVPISGYCHAYTVPSENLRLLDVNGETWEQAAEFMELEGTRLLTNQSPVTIRYVRRIGVAEFDPLLAAAVSMALALKICVPLTANLQLQGQMSALANQAISRARQADALEVGNKENGGLHRLIQRSPLVNSRWGYGSRRDPLRYHTPY